MNERLSKLLTVKSLVTIALTVVFCALSVTGVVTGEQFLTVFTVVISFYFGTQAEKKSQNTAEPLEAIPLENVLDTDKGGDYNESV